MPARMTLPRAKRVSVSRPLWPLLSIGLFALNPLSSALAETGKTEDSTLTLGTVTVQGASASSGPLSTSSVLSSVDILGADILEKMPVNYSWELFSRAPGVILTEFNQGTTSGKISFRGFNGEGEVNAVKLLIDGIPSNSNDGNMPFMDMIFPMELDSIEVVRGTSDARYGLNNIAGNVNMLTRTGGDYTKARVRYGSYNTQETQLAKGIEGSNWTQNYFFAYQKSDGYRDHAEADRFSMSGKWFYTPDDNSYRIGLIARHYETEAQEPGYLSEEDAHQHPTMTNSYNATDKGTRRMNQVSLHFDTDLAETLAWSAKTYVNTFDDRRWTQYWRTSAQQERDAYETQYGALTSLTWRPQVSWLYDFALEGGADMQQQQNKSERYRTKDRLRLAQTRDQRFDFDTYGAYVQAEIKPFESLKIVPAYRVDKIQGDFTNEMTGMDYDINDYGLIKQPKLSVVYSPWDVASIYANWGRTFQVGTGAAAYKIPPRIPPGAVDQRRLGNRGQVHPGGLDRRPHRLLAARSQRRSQSPPQRPERRVGQRRRNPALGLRRASQSAPGRTHRNLDGLLLAVLENPPAQRDLAQQQRPGNRPHPASPVQRRRQLQGHAGAAVDGVDERPDELLPGTREHQGHLRRLRLDEPRRDLPGDRIGQCRPAVEKPHQPLLRIRLV